MPRVDVHSELLTAPSTSLGHDLHGAAFVVATSATGLTSIEMPASYVDDRVLPVVCELIEMLLSCPPIEEALRTLYEQRAGDSRWSEAAQILWSSRSQSWAREAFARDGLDARYGPGLIAAMHALHEKRREHRGLDTRVRYQALERADQRAGRSDRSFAWVGGVQADRGRSRKQRLFAVAGDDVTAVDSLGRAEHRARTGGQVLAVPYVLITDGARRPGLVASTSPRDVWSTVQAPTVEQLILARILWADMLEVVGSATPTRPDSEKTITGKAARRRTRNPRRT